MKRQPLLFSIGSYAYMAERICKAQPFERGKIDCKQFPDGERYQRILTEVAEREVVLVGGTASDSDTLELYDLACALVKHGAMGLTLVVPYYGYSTMERTVLNGEVITAKTRARLLSSIPAAPTGTRILLMDLHAAGVAFYFEDDIVPVHLYAKQVVLAAIQRLGGERFVLASTDAGRAKWVESLANDLGVDAAFVFKRRIDGATTELIAMNARVEGQRVIIYDDMIRTGGSLINAARAYRDAGAVSVAAIATHGVLPQGAIEKIAAAGILDAVVVTDTHPRTQEISHPLLQVESVAGIFAQWIATHFRQR